MLGTFYSHVGNNRKTARSILKEVCRGRGGSLGYPHTTDYPHAEAQRAQSSHRELCFPQNCIHPADNDFLSRRNGGNHRYIYVIRQIQIIRVRFILSQIAQISFPFFSVSSVINILCANHHENQLWLRLPPPRSTKSIQV